MKNVIEGEHPSLQPINNHLLILVLCHCRLNCSDTYRRTHSVYFLCASSSAENNHYGLIETLDLYQLKSTTGAAHWVCTSPPFPSLDAYRVALNLLVQDSSWDFVFSLTWGQFASKGP